MPEGRLQRTRAIYTTPAQITADVAALTRREIEQALIETDYWNVIEGEDHDLTQPTPFRRLR
jgi:hypothetical protein